MKRRRQLVHLLVTELLVWLATLATMVYGQTLTPKVPGVSSLRASRTETNSLAASVSLQAPMPLQTPTVSHQSIVFSLAGDLWIVDRSGGEARRLTTDPAEEINPVFSPDGSQIAFTKSAGADADVYLITAAGGEARRLTYHPKPDMALGWTPDGKSVLFASMRNYDSVWRLYTVPAQGGFPTELPFPMGVAGAFSPDGTRIAYLPVRELSRAWRNYRGGLASPIWIAKLSDSSFVELPRENSNDSDPMWVGANIYFVSDRTGTANLFVYDTKTKKVNQLTKFEKYDIKAASACGDAIVFAQGGALHLYDLQTNQERTVDVRITGEFPEVKPRTVKAARWIRSFELSPDGSQAVFNARGEILVVDAEKGVSRNLTQTPGVAERSPVWAPDGKTIAYFSDESGEYQLHVRPVNGEGSERKIPIEPSPSFYSELAWAPDSRKLAFSDKRLSLWLVDLDTGVVKRIDSSTYPGHDAYYPAWSPDSQWLAYSKSLPNRIRAIFAHSIMAGKSYPVTDGRSDAEFPVFDQSGKYLYFTASDTAGPSKNWGMSAIMFSALMANRVYVAVLQKDDRSPLLSRGGEENGNKTRSAGIDIENIGQRILRLPIPARNYVKLAAGKPGSLFIMERNLSGLLSGERSPQTLYKFDLSTRRNDKLIEDIDGFTVSADGGKLLYRKGGNWAMVSTEAALKPDAGRLDLGNLEISVEPRAEWKQMFDELWRIQHDYFIDPNSFGQNLAGLKAVYAAYLPNVCTRSDLNYLFREMVSHMSISHMGVGGGDLPSLPASNVGLLGADYQIDQGRYRITRVYRGDNSEPLLSGPLAQPGMNVKAGEYLLEVDGQQILAEESLYRYFQGKVGRPVQLKVGPDAQGRGARMVTVVPLPGENSLRRYDWAEQNRRQVEELSDGKLGYMYLPDFGLRGYLAFTRDFYAQVDKQGLIIDQRFSPGGATADYFIETLKRAPLSYYAFREGEDMPFPVGALAGPKVLIINQFNGSSADTFPWLFREAQVGLLVGKRTVGAGIGHYFDIPELIDGGRVAAPNRAHYNPKNGSLDIENYGVAPDVEVELSPAAMRSGHDPQLEKAVQIAMDGLKKIQSVSPKKPKYPVYK